MIKKRETITDEDFPIKIYPNKIKSKITFKIKKGYKLELLTEETQKLLGSSKKEIDEDKDGELVPKIENVDVVLIHCNASNNTHQQQRKVLYWFLPNKKFSQLTNIESQSLIILQIITAEFSFIEVWLTNQNNEPLETEDSVDITLIIGPNKTLI